MDISPDSRFLRETCLGIPLTNERLLDESENAEIGAQVQQSTKRGCAWGCASPGIFVVAISFAAVVGDLVGENSPVQTYLTILVIVCTLGFPALFLLRANDLWKLRQAARLDLKQGKIKSYQGLLPGADLLTKPNSGAETSVISEETQTSPSPEPEAPAQISIGNIIVAPNEAITLEVLEGSRRLWQVNGERVHSFVILPQELTAPQPAQAEVAAKWAQPAIQVADNVLDASQAGKRDLSFEESEEIRRRAKTLWRRPGLSALLFSAWIGIPLILHLTTKTPMRMEPMAYVIIALAIWSNFNFARVLLWSRQLLRDAQNGEVIVTRLPSPVEPASIETKNPVIELLPESKWIWSEDGQPATWRLQR